MAAMGVLHLLIDIFQQVGFMHEDIAGVALNCTWGDAHLYRILELASFEWLGRGNTIGMRHHMLIAAAAMDCCLWAAMLLLSKAECSPNRSLIHTQYGNNL